MRYDSYGNDVSHDGQGQKEDGHDGHGEKRVTGFGDNPERARLLRREAELLKRIERLRKSMNETKELRTLAFKSKLYDQARQELQRIQEKLAGIDHEGDAQ